jgi:hypothetical protein
VANTRTYTDFWQGAGIDRVRLTQSIARPEEAAKELQAVAKKLGAVANALTPETNAMRRGWEYWAREARCARWLTESWSRDVLGAWGENVLDLLRPGAKRVSA